MRVFRDAASRVAWAFVNWWLRRAGRVAVPATALDNLPIAAHRMEEHITKSGHLARVYHVRWRLEMALADLRRDIGKLLS